LRTSIGRYALIIFDNNDCTSQKYTKIGGEYSSPEEKPHALPPAPGITEVMVMRLFAIVTVLAVGLAIPAAAEQLSEHDAHQAAHSTLDAWNKASEQKDAAGRAALYTEDALQITPEGLISGRAAIQKSSVEDFKAFTYDPAKLERVIMIGNSIMLSAGTWSGTYSSPDGPVPMKGYWSDISVPAGNTWMIRQETYNVAPPPETKK
jgi:ketosteroid isomerase-like protein